MTLDEMPSWILSNIQFPQEAYKYGIAGIEQVCISASWDGKVFITSILNTLNPAFEKEIMDVISKAPRCRYNGSQPKDIYKYMLIDFHQYRCLHFRHNILMPLPIVRSMAVLPFSEKIL